MKTKIIILMAMLLGSIACDDLLEEDPQTFISPDDFFKSFDDFESAVKGIYALIPAMNETNIKELFADYNDLPESAEQTGDIWKNNPGANFWPIRRAWGVPYRIISNANQILASLEASSLSDAQKTLIAAETKLLRAYAYFHLVQYFGDVPIRTEPVKAVTGPEDTQIERSPQAEAYSLIFDDLKAAEAGLPLPVPAASPQEGRVNSYVAKALLARAYLTSAGFPMNMTGNYVLARDKAVEVIEGPYSLKENFSDVFKNNAYTDESIWEIIYLDGVATNPKHVQTAPTGNQSAILLPSAEFIESFPAGDRRREWGIQDGYTTKKGTNWIKRTYYNKFIDESQLEAELGPSATITDYTFPIIRLAEMYLIAAEAENEIAGPTEAYRYINEIRKRARIDENDASHVPDLSGLTQEEFRKAVRDERKWELFTEEHAWFDLKRTNSFQSVQDARGSQLIVPIGSYNTTWILPDFEVLNNDIPDNPSYGG